jgi:hypothetical protein
MGRLARVEPGPLSGDRWGTGAGAVSSWRRAGIPISLEVGLRAMWIVLIGTIAGGFMGVTHAGGRTVGGAHDGARVLSYAISPNGKRLAEVEAGGALSGPQELVIVRRLQNRTGQGRRIFVGSGIGAVYWASDSEILFTRARRGGEIVLENVETGATRRLLRSRHRISIAAFERRRGLLAYEYSEPWRWHHRVSVRVTDAMTVEELIAPVWARWPGTEVVGAIKVGGLRSARAAQAIPLRLDRFTAPFPPSLIWRQGRLLAFVSAMHQWHTRIFDLQSGRRIDRGMPFFRLLDERASPNGRLAVWANSVWRHRSRRRCGCGGSPNVFVLDPDEQAKRISAVGGVGTLWNLGGFWWSGRRRLFVQVMGYKGGGVMRWWLEEVDTKTNRLVRTYDWPSGDLGGDSFPCDFDADRTRAVCGGQSLTDPPVLVDVNLVTGAMRILGKINPALHRLSFKFSRVRIPTRFGFTSTGLLALPRRADEHPVPLAVMAYGFSEAYSRDAQWITSYPVARFVQAGIAVLLVNWARSGATQLHLAPSADLRRALQSAVSLFANAVPAVRATGVRISRAMVMGWSFGGLFAAHAIQSLHDYVAAQVGDPAAYNVMQYGLGNAFWRDILRWNLGGPPVARYLANYRYMDPAGDGRAAHGPILFEFVSRNPDAGELLQEWRAVGTDVEAFAYRRSVHWLSVPAEARISRLRNLYWAEINLLGPQSVTAAQLRSVGLTVPRKGWWSAQPSFKRAKVTTGRSR